MSTATTALAAIGLKAIEFSAATSARFAALAKFREACREWHQENGDTYIEKSSPEWAEMLKACDAEYSALMAAKAGERNARERLLRACRRAAS